MKIGILGYGSLGRAIDARLRYCGFQNIYTSRRSLKYGESEGTKIRANAEVVRESDIFNICVKQKDLKDVATETKDLMDNKLGVSFVAGVWLEDLEKVFGGEAKISRAMTSLAFAEGKAITAVAYGRKLDEDEKNLMREYLSLGGNVMELEEERFDAFTAAYACAIGLVDKFQSVFSDEEKMLRAMIGGTEAVGFNKSEAELLASGALEGYKSSARGLRQGDFYKKVASGGGMTEAGWNEFEIKLQEAVEHCYKAAVARGKELREKARKK